MKSGQPPEDNVGTCNDGETTSAPERERSDRTPPRLSVDVGLERRERLAAFVRRHPRLTPPLEVTSLTWYLRGLPRALDGLTIAQVSDLHVGEGSWGAMRLREAIAAIHDAAPDLVVNTGDFLQHDPPVEKVIAEFQPLVRASANAGHVAILGNHDYYAGEEHVRRLKGWLCDLGVEMLVNQVRVLAYKDASVTLAGLTCEEPGMEAALEELATSPRPRIVLVHEPEVAERLSAEIADLVFAGHTHGGQITLPFLKRAIVKRFCGSGYVDGLYRIAGNPVYINRGLGCTGLPWRFRAQPEVTIVRLRR